MGPGGEAITDDAFLLLLSAAEHDLDFTIPSADYGGQSVTVMDTADPLRSADPPAVKSGDQLALSHHSLRVPRRG